MPDKNIKLTFALVLLTLFTICTAFAETNSTVYVISLKDNVINPVVSKFISDGIDKAYENHASCIVIELDTPGGLLDSTRIIVKKILNAPLPVIVYVSPRGARATSAGVFITCSAHIAAMSPSTHIGAAHPVNIGMPGMKDIQKIKEFETSQKEQKKHENLSSQNILSQKIMADTVAWITAIANKRNRNAAWMREAVEKSVSINEEEAIKKNVVDIIADSLDDLLNKIDGKSVSLSEGDVTLNTKNRRITYLSFSKSEKFLNAISNPNIAYIFMILGMIGLIFEFSHPGIGFPGIAGLICLLLAFFSFNTLPISYTGLALIVLSLILFVSEVFTPTFGILTLGGITCLIIGSTMLIDSGYPLLTISLKLIVGTSITFGLFMTFVTYKIIKAQKIPVTTGKEGLIGTKGETITELNPKGKVFAHGETWNASSQNNENIPKNCEIEIVNVEHLKLIVKKI